MFKAEISCVLSKNNKCEIMLRCDDVCKTKMPQGRQITRIKGDKTAQV